MRITKKDTIIVAAAATFALTASSFVRQIAYPQRVSAFDADVAQWCAQESACESPNSFALCMGFLCCGYNGEPYCGHYSGGQCSATQQWEIACWEHCTGADEENGENAAWSYACL